MADDKIVPPKGGLTATQVAEGIEQCIEINGGGESPVLLGEAQVVAVGFNHDTGNIFLKVAPQ